MENKKVLLGMSGGVDSSAAAILLQEQGYEVIGVTMSLYGKDTVSDDAKKVCDVLGIMHYTIDYKKEFEKHVINDFICEYKKCRTPNPCIECNKYLKFGAMYEKAKELGCEYLATGHYAKVEYDERFNGNVIRKSNAGKKDQSYVLYNMPKEILNHILMPLGEFENKEQIRAIVASKNLEIANKPDSEDICFIPDGDYKKFLESNSDIKSKEGNIVGIDGKILGKHEGLYKYTIGQRKGLGIAYKVPLFVVGFNLEKNEVIVGEEEYLYSKIFEVNQINLMHTDRIDTPIDVDIKIRYAANPAHGKIIQISDDEIEVTFDEPQKSVTPGQSAVFYIDDVVIGGGKIK